VYALDIGEFPFFHLPVLPPSQTQNQTQPKLENATKAMTGDGDANATYFMTSISIYSKDLLQ